MIDIYIYLHIYKLIHKYLEGIYLEGESSRAGAVVELINSLIKG